MIKHCIFIFSDYILGKRIGFHLESDDHIFILNESKKLLSKLKNQYSSIKCGIYYVNTDKRGWDEVIKYDKFFSDIELKNKIDFIRTIKENLYLKEFEEQLIEKISTNDYFSDISLLSRKNNLGNDLDELNNLKNLKQFKSDLEKEFEELDGKIKMLNLLMLLLQNKEKTIYQKTYLNFELKQLKKKKKEIIAKKLHPIYKLYYTVKILRFELELLKKIVPAKTSNKEIENTIIEKKEEIVKK